MLTSPITTHVLDQTTGRPAAGVIVTLQVRRGAGWDDLGHGATDADGRLRDLLPADHPLAPGVYRLDFQTATYFDGRGLATFYPGVTIQFTVADPMTHYHVPLLLSPFGYSTYRGS